MLNKIRNYYQAFGFKETIKKIGRFTIFKSKLSKYGVYNLSKKEKNVIKNKNKKIYVLSNEPYNELKNDKLKSIIDVLNNMGVSINYYFSNNKKTKHPLPLTVHNNIKYAHNIKFNKNDIVIVDEVDNNFDDVLLKIKKVNARLIKSSVLTINIDNNINELKIYDEKCNKKFYNNISVIVLNYNNKNIIFDCIDLLKKYNSRYKYEIIVVDNGSTDGSYELLKEKYRNIILIKNNKNGCSSGRNLGVKNASKEYVIFLDSDQLVQSKYWLDCYIEILMNNDIGAIGWAAGWFNNKGYSYHTVDNFEYRYMPPIGLYRNDIGYIGSGGMMMKKILFESIHGFDEEYDPTCYEDTDISLKIRDYGKEIVYSPYLLLEHIAHQTTKSGSKEHEKRIMEKGNYFVNKWKNINPNLLKYRK